jgi:hypothetical protein
MNKDAQDNGILPCISERFILCECNSEALLLTRFYPDKEIYLSIYTIGQFQKKPNIWERMKYCYHHLKTGKKYEDQIILNFEKAQQISEWLSLNAR